MNVLIVEDEALNVQLMEYAIQKNGSQVVRALSSGEEVLQFLDDADFSTVDLILMDIRLNGELDGIETVHRIHERKNIPVVYVTASTDEETYARAKETAMIGYLKKPYVLEELFQMLNSVVAEGRSAALRGNI